MHDFCGYQFIKVIYDKKYPEIDFFRSIGRLPFPVLTNNWYASGDGEVSSCVGILKDQDQWRKNYWDRFYNSISIKLKDWSYEKEYRLILNAMMNDFSGEKKEN